MKKKKYGGYKNLHEDKTGLLKHREWRGFKDTLVDYWRWLVTWKDMVVMVLKNPVAVVKGLWRYRWMATYLSFYACVRGSSHRRFARTATSDDASSFQYDRQARDGTHSHRVRGGRKDVP